MARPPLDIGNADPKGLLKGKGAQRPRGGRWPAPVPVPAITNAREAEHWLRVFGSERAEVLVAFHVLQQRFADEVPAPLARLVRRQGGGLLWRKRSARPETQTLFELAGEVGRELLQGLSPAERRPYLDAEAERLRLNACWAIVNAATRSLSHYLERYRAIRALRKSSETG
ncbi:MAG: hypothetical protein ACREXU_11590 [Gammaproteobacteria bacterium]